MTRFACLTVIIFMRLSAASVDASCSVTIAHSSETVSSNACGLLVHPLGASVLVEASAERIRAKLESGSMFGETFFISGSVQGNAVPPAKTLVVPGPAGTGVLDYYFHVGQDISASDLEFLNNTVRGPLFAAIDGTPLPAFKVGEFGIQSGDIGIIEVYRIRTPFQYNVPFELSVYFPVSITFDTEVSPFALSRSSFVSVSDLTYPIFPDNPGFPIGIVVVPEPATLFLVCAGGLFILLSKRLRSRTTMAN